MHIKLRAVWNCFSIPVCYIMSYSALAASALKKRTQGKPVSPAPVFVRFSAKEKYPFSRAASVEKRLLEGKVAHMSNGIRSVVLALVEQVKDRLFNDRAFMAHLEEQKNLMALLRQRFRADLFSFPPRQWPQFPEAFLDSANGVFAYALHFLPAKHFEAPIENLIRTHFPQVLSRAGHDLWAKNQGSGVILRTLECKEFNSPVFCIRTNFAPFLEDLYSLNIHPPMPWESWPCGLLPLCHSSGQNKAEWWWCTFWKPYWQSLSADEQLDFAERHTELAAWLEYFTVYAPFADKRLALRRQRDS